MVKINYETLLLNSIVETGDVDVCMEQNVGAVFFEHGEIWNFLLDFYKEYGESPSKDVIRNNFKEFEFFKVESPLQYYIDDAKRQSLSKGIRASLMEAVEKLKGGTEPSSVLSFIQNRSSELMRDTGKLTDVNVVNWEERANILEERLSNPEEHILGVTSGIQVIDNMFGGWQSGDFIVLIAETGVGKSFVTRLFAVNAWNAGYTPLVISLEMDRLQEEYRIDTILNHGNHFTNSQLMNGKGIDIKEYKGWAEGTFEGKQPFHLITSEGVDQADQNFIEAKIKQYKPDMVVIDSHLLCEDSRGGGNEVERAKNLSRDFKKMALRNSTPIIDVSQVTMKDSFRERAPELNEVAWGKQLSRDADLVLALHREPDSNVFQCISRKTRRNKDFAFYLDWDLDSGRWNESFSVGDF